MQDFSSETPLSAATERLVVVSRLAANAFLAAAGFVLLAWAIMLTSVISDLDDRFFGAPDGPTFGDYSTVVLNYGSSYLWTATALAGIGAGLRVYSESQAVRQERHDELLGALEALQREDAVSDREG